MNPRKSGNVVRSVASAEHSQPDQEVLGSLVAAGAWGEVKLPFELGIGRQRCSPFLTPCPYGNDRRYLVIHAVAGLPLADLRGACARHLASPLNSGISCPVIACHLSGKTAATVSATR